MKIKKFVAPTIKQALAEIKKELGEDAVILNSKKVKPNLFNKDMFEVTAARDELDQPVTKRMKTVLSDTYIPQSDSRKKTDWKSIEKLTQISSEMSEIKATIQQMAGRVKFSNLSNLPPSLTKLYIDLLNVGVNNRTAQELIQQISTDLPGDEANRTTTILKGKMAKKITTQPIARPVDDHPYVIALIGPTGVGKTTTLAKMATHPQIYGRGRIAFISADTYRIAAIEQLRTFARIAEIPLEVTYTLEEIQHAILKHRDKEVILIDTPGRSPNNQQHLSEMRDVLERAQPNEIHLVLSITTRYEDISDIINKYKMMHVNRFLFTKFDETTSPGTLINVVDQFHTPLSFITNGQEVPDDIKVVSAPDIVNLILKENQIQ